MSPLLLVVPTVVQGLAMSVDEGWYHRRRGLPRWERIGHPLDTLTVVACYAWTLAFSFEHAGAPLAYAILAVFSCVFITKDEFIHASRCSPGEIWLHSVLFVLHPIVLGATGYLWFLGGHRALIVGQLVIALGFAAYQFVYWRFLWQAPQSNP